MSETYYSDFTVRQLNVFPSEQVTAWHVPVQNPLIAQIGISWNKFVNSVIDHLCFLERNAAKIHC